MSIATFQIDSKFIFTVLFLHKVRLILRKNIIIYICFRRNTLNKIKTLLIKKSKCFICITRLRWRHYNVWSSICKIKIGNIKSSILIGCICEIKIVNTKLSILISYIQNFLKDRLILILYFDKTEMGLAR